MISFIIFSPLSLLLSGNCPSISHFPQILVSGSASGEPNSTRHRVSTFCALFPPIFKTKWPKTSTRHFPNSLMVKQDQRLLVSFTPQCQESQGSTPSLSQCLAIMLHHAVHPTSLYFSPTAQTQGRWFIPESGPWRQGVWRKCTNDGEEADMRVCSTGLPVGLSLLQLHLCKIM